MKHLKILKINKKLKAERVMLDTYIRRIRANKINKIMIIVKLTLNKSTKKIGAEILLD